MTTSTSHPDALDALVPARRARSALLVRPAARRIAALLERVAVAQGVTDPRGRGRTVRRYSRASPPVIPRPSGIASWCAS